MGKKTNKNIIKSIKMWYANRNRLERTLLWSLLSAFFISCMFYAGVEAWNGYHGLYISAFECRETAMSVLGLSQSTSWWQTALILYYPYIKWLLIALGLSWILHGVQARLLA